MPDIKDYTLRAMQITDLDIVHHWRNLPHIRACMFNDAIISSQDHANWFKQTLAKNDVDYQILIYQGHPAGLANATDFDSTSKSCHWGFYLGEQDLPKGSGTIMARLMLEYLFKKYDINTIISQVFSFNQASLKLHEKLHFRIQPEHIKTVKKNGRDETVLTLSLDRTRWKRTSAELKLKTCQH